MHVRLWSVLVTCRPNICKMNLFGQQKHNQIQADCSLSFLPALDRRMSRWRGGTTTAGGKPFADLLDIGSDACERFCSEWRKFDGALTFFCLKALCAICKLIGPNGSCVFTNCIEQPQHLHTPGHRFCSAESVRLGNSPWLSLVGYQTTTRWGVLVKERWTNHRIRLVDSGETLGCLVQLGRN